MNTALITNRKQTERKRFRKRILRNWDLYILLVPVICYFLLFIYFPMYGLQIAFKDFIATKGIVGSPWVGFKHFSDYFNSYYFWRLIGNTLGISAYQLVAGFPIPIILAILMNELTSVKFKKVLQTATYAPHFLSIIVVAGMITAFLSPSNGIVNKFLGLFSAEPQYFLAKPEYFKSIYVWSGIWQNAGWGSIIYMAALSGIDITYYEAAIVDGATKIQRIFYITLPCLLPTAVILLIMNTGHIMSVGFEKAFLLQNNMNIQASDIISTYVYRTGLIGGRFSYTSAIGFFNSVINCILLLSVNKIAKFAASTSLW